MAERAKKYIEIEIDASQAIAKLKGIDKSANESEKGLKRLRREAGLLKRVFQASAAYFGLREFAALGDAALNIEGRLRAVSQAAQANTDVFAELLTIANVNGAAIDELAASYQKLGVPIPEASHKELIGTLDLLSGILSTTGASAQQTTAVLSQFSQAMGSAALQGDEFRSVYENAPVLLRAWQQAAGLTGTALKDLSANALLTKESFFKYREEIQEIAQEMIGMEEPPLTLSRAFTALRNNLISLTRDAENNIGVFNALASAVKLIADNLKVLLEVLAGVLVFFAVRGALVAGIAAATAAMVSFNAAVTAGATVLIAMRNVLGSLMAFMGLPGLIAAAIGVAVTAILHYWSTLEDLPGLTELYLEKVVLTIELWMTKAVDVVNSYLADLLETYASGWDKITSVYEFFGMESAAATTALASSSLKAAAAMRRSATETEYLEDAIAITNVEIEDYIATMGSAESSGFALGRSQLEVAKTIEATGQAAKTTARELKKVNRAMDDAKYSIEDYLAGLRNEIELAGLSGDALIRRRIEIELTAKATDLYRKSIDAAQQGEMELAESLRQAGAAWKAAIPHVQEMALQLDTAKNKVDIVGDALKDAGDAFRSEFSNLINDGLNLNLDSFNKFADGVLRAINRIMSDAITQQFMRWIMGMMGGSTTGFGGFFNAVFGSTVAPAAVPGVAPAPAPVSSIPATAAPSQTFSATAAPAAISGASPTTTQSMATPGNTTVNITVVTPDASSFNRSSSEIAAQIGQQIDTATYSRR